MERTHRPYKRAAPSSDGLVVDGPSIERQIPCWGEAGEWGRSKSLTHKKPNQTAHMTHKHSTDRVGDEILRDGNARRTDGDIQRLAYIQAHTRIPCLWRVVQC